MCVCARARAHICVCVMTSQTILYVGTNVSFTKCAVYAKTGLYTDKFHRELRLSKFSTFRMHVSVVNTLKRQ